MGVTAVKNTRILICEDSLEGILTAVHEAYVSRYGLHDIRVEITEGDPELFTEKVWVATNIAAAVKVADTIKKKMSETAFWIIRRAAHAANPEKAHAIYRMIVYGFHMGPSVLDCLAEPSVQLVHKLSRQVGRETEKLYGFVRFRTLTPQLLFAEISPKHRQLELLADHFADRFVCENWIICDVVRHMACIHPKHQTCVFISYESKEDILPQTLKLSENDIYGEMWLAFCETITIEQRKNPRQQMNLMPKRYWKHLPEMQDKIFS